ncbi:MAG: hypothetical protein ACRECV_12460 [Xanthobacteraceae bacterium]
MSPIFSTARPAGGEPASGTDRQPAAHAVADWLCLAATPTFALMALLTALGGGHEAMFCAAMQTSSPAGGMAPMYLLMSAFHAAPWLKRIAGSAGGA